MPISSSNQAYIFLCSVLGGILIAFIYDVFRIKRKAIKTNNIILYIEDLVYWLIVSLVMFAVVYYSNEGEIRGYIFVGTVIGVILYVLLLSRLVMGVSLAVLRLVYRTAKKVWAVVTYPIRVILKLLSIPGNFLLRLFLKGWRKARRIGKNQRSKVALWRRILKNIRKKI